MSLLDKVVSTVTPEPSNEEMARARAEARSSSRDAGWLAMVLDHHQQIEALFAAMKSASSPSTQRELERKLALLLTAHSIAEEGVLYPAMALDDQKAHSATAYTQQSAAKVQIAALEQMQPMSRDYMDKLEHLRAAVAHHVYQEEKEWFPKLNEVGAPEERARLTQRYSEEFERYLCDDAQEFDQRELR